MGRGPFYGHPYLQGGQEQGSLDALAANLPGRRGMSAEQVALEAAQAEIERLKSTVTEQAVSRHLVEG